jgi:hypothetical protein
LPCFSYSRGPSNFALLGRTRNRLKSKTTAKSI